MSPAKRGRSGATRLDAGEHTRTLTVRRCPSSTTTSCGRRKLRIRHFLVVANTSAAPAGDGWTDRRRRPCLSGRGPRCRRWQGRGAFGYRWSGLRCGVRARCRGRTLVTAPSSDRPSRSLLLCHGSRSLSSRSSPRGLRRRGPAASPEDLPTLQPPVRHLRGVRPGACLLHAAVPRRRSPPVGAGCQGPPSTESRRPSRPSRPAARLSQPPARDGSVFHRSGAIGQTRRP